MFLAVLEGAVVCSVAVRVCIPRFGPTALTVFVAVLEGADVAFTVCFGPCALTVKLAVLKGADVAAIASVSEGPGTLSVDLAVLHITFIDGPTFKRDNSFAVWDAADSFARVLAFIAVDVLKENTSQQLKERG